MKKIFLSICPLVPLSIAPLISSCAQNNTPEILNKKIDNLTNLSTVNPSDVLGETSNKNSMQIIDALRGGNPEIDPLNYREITKLKDEIKGINNSEIFSQDVSEKNYKNFFKMEDLAPNLSKEYSIKTYFHQYLNSDENGKIKILISLWKNSELIFKKFIMISGFKIKEIHVFNDENPKKKLERKIKELNTFLLEGKKNLEDYCKNAPMWVLQGKYKKLYQLLGVDARQWVFWENNRVESFFTQKDKNSKLVVSAIFNKRNYMTEKILLELEFQKLLLKTAYFDEKGNRNLDFFPPNFSDDGKIPRVDEKNNPIIYWFSLKDLAVKKEYYQAILNLIEFNKHKNKTFFSQKFDFKNDFSNDIKILLNNRKQLSLRNFNFLPIKQKLEYFWIPTLIRIPNQILILIYNMISHYVADIFYDELNNEFVFVPLYREIKIGKDKNALTLYQINNEAKLPRLRIKVSEIENFFSKLI